MKRNGMCPICYLKKLFTRPSRVSDLYSNVEYKGGDAPTPPMGWSSWNTFKNTIDEDLIYETAVAMKEKGLLDAGYDRINIDDNWHSSLRDENGEVQHDLTKFAHGMKALVAKINALGLKAGIYSSNGTLTCEDLPAGYGNEYKRLLPQRAHPQIRAARLRHRGGQAGGAQGQVLSLHGRQGQRACQVHARQKVGVRLPRQRA